MFTTPLRLLGEPETQTDDWGTPVESGPAPVVSESRANVQTKVLRTELDDKGNLRGGAVGFVDVYFPLGTDLSGYGDGATLEADVSDSKTLTLKVEQVVDTEFYLVCKITGTKSD